MHPNLYGRLNRAIHIISFDIPYPPDYGGVIDVFFKIKALHAHGIHVHLHCFYDKRSPSPLLEEICTRVYYYPRKNPLISLPVRYPYMVFSRRSEKLMHNLKTIQAPVLLEGLHTCFHLKEIGEMAGYPCFIRMHNDEPEYYRLLGKSEKELIPKLYFQWEASRLQAFEPVIAAASKIFTISPADTNYFSKKYPKVKYLPAFHPYDTVNSQPGKGDFALYHGNLAVIENHIAVMFLIKNVFSKVDYPLIIAGSAPRKELLRETGGFRHIQLIANPDAEQMQTLIRQAHIHLLPTFQATGIKLKLLNALFNGRFVLTNPDMIENTGLDSLCVCCESAEEFIIQIQHHQHKSFPEAEILKRKTIMESLFSNIHNAKMLIKEIFD